MFMRQRLSFLSTWVCLAAMLLAGSQAHAGEPESATAATEKAHIELLLQAMAESKAVFIRNGKEYSGAEAAAHMRDKWTSKPESAKTARQFIKLFASKSEFSGEPYQIKLPGSPAPSPLTEWLEAVLSAEESREKKAAEAAKVVKGATQAPPDLKVLLAQLGHDSFEEREKATEALIGLGAAALDEVTKCEGTTTDPEIKARCGKIRAAIGDPDTTALRVLKLIERSKATFLRPDAALRKTFTGPQFAAHLRAKAALQKFTLTRPAQEFIDEVATKSSLHDTAYRVRLEDGTEKDLKDWLEEKSKARRQEEESVGPGKQ